MLENKFKYISDITKPVDALIARIDNYFLVNYPELWRRDYAFVFRMCFRYILYSFIIVTLISVFSTIFNVAFNIDLLFSLQVIVYLSFLFNPLLLFALLNGTFPLASYRQIYSAKEIDFTFSKKSEFCIASINLVLCIYSIFHPYILLAIIGLFQFDQNTSDKNNTSRQTSITDIEASENKEYDISIFRDITEGQVYFMKSYFQYDSIEMYKEIRDSIILKMNLDSLQTESLKKYLSEIINEVDLADSNIIIYNYKTAVSPDGDNEIIILSDIFKPDNLIRHKVQYGKLLCHIELDNKYKSTLSNDKILKILKFLIFFILSMGLTELYFEDTKRRGVKYYDYSNILIGIVEFIFKVLTFLFAYALILFAIYIIFGSNSKIGMLIFIMKDIVYLLLLWLFPIITNVIVFIVLILFYVYPIVFFYAYFVRFPRIKYNAYVRFYQPR